MCVRLRLNLGSTENDLASGSIGTALIIEPTGLIPGSSIQWSQGLMFEDWLKVLTLKQAWKLSLQGSCPYPQTHGHGLFLDLQWLPWKGSHWGGPCGWACGYHPGAWVCWGLLAWCWSFLGWALVPRPVKTDFRITVLHPCRAHLHALLPRLGGESSWLMWSFHRCSMHHCLGLLHSHQAL